MAGDYPEKRRFPRISSENAVLVKRLGPEALENFARTRVMGLGGCMFVSDTAFGVDSPVEILISVRGQVIKATARVVWELPAAEGKTEIGVEFADIAQQDRLAIEKLFVDS
jgi:hypothetical protein